MFDARPLGSAAIRVAHLSPTYFSPDWVVGGGERYVFNLASALAAIDPEERFDQAIFALADRDSLAVHGDIPVRLLRNENPSPSAMLGVSGNALAAVRAAPELSAGHFAELAIRVREAALADVRAEVRRELAGARTEMRAMSHRFASIEERLQTISRWLDGVEKHTSGLAEETRTGLATLRHRIEAIGRLAEVGGSSDPAASTFQGSDLILATGPYGRFMVRHPDVVGDAIVRGEFWDAYLKDAIEAHADPERVAIDAGAYIGFRSVFLSRHFARVHAFEPQPQVYSLLRTNIELNGTPQHRGGGGGPL